MKTGPGKQGPHAMQLQLILRGQPHLVALLVTHIPLAGQPLRILAAHVPVASEIAPQLPHGLGRSPRHGNFGNCPVRAHTITVNVSAATTGR